MSNVNERSKALENESFPLAFSKLALPEEVRSWWRNEIKTETGVG